MPVRKNYVQPASSDLPVRVEVHGSINRGLIVRAGFSPQAYTRDLR
jgi:hypothetical protein